MFRKVVTDSVLMKLIRHFESSLNVNAADFFVDATVPCFHLQIN